MNPVLVVSIVVAVIAVVGSVIVALLRKPVNVQDLWTENRALRTDMIAQDSRIEALETKYEQRDQERQRVIGILATGFDVLWHLLEQMRASWGTTDTPPELAPEELAIIDAARRIRPTTIVSPR